MLERDKERITTTETGWQGGGKGKSEDYQEIWWNDVDMRQQTQRLAD